MSSDPRNPFAAHDPYAQAAGGGTPAFGAPPAGAVPAAAQAAELVIDVTEADFEIRVLERSLEVPVLLDCWAPWCGPCRALGPLLEKLAQAYGGRFVLAKINTDEAPNLSAALRIRSIPLVVLFAGGRPVDQFVGALPEGQIRQFLDKHLASFRPPADPLEELLAAAAQARSEGRPEEADALLHEVLAVDPAHADALQDLADSALGAGAHDEAEALLGRVPATARGDRHAALSKRIDMARNRPGGDPRALLERIAVDPRDFEARFALAALLMHDGDYHAAFDQLLDVVLRDKGSGEDSWRQRARRQLVEWFALCPDAEAVSRGRRYLGMYLN